MPRIAQPAPPYAGNDTNEEGGCFGLPQMGTDEHRLGSVGVLFATNYTNEEKVSGLVFSVSESS